MMTRNDSLAQVMNSNKRLGDYENLIAELKAVENRAGVDLCDQATDRENVLDEGISGAAPNYYDRLIASRLRRSRPARRSGRH